MRDVFENNQELLVNNLLSCKAAYLKKETLSGEFKLAEIQIKAFRCKSKELTEILDENDNLWCGYYAPGIGAFLEDLLPKGDSPGEGWTLLSW